VQIWRAAGADWSDMAILGVNHDDLDAFRSVAEAESIPLNVRVVSKPAMGSGLPPFWRMRESMWLLERLRDQPERERPRGMQNLLACLCAACGRSRWTDLLADAVAAFSKRRRWPTSGANHLHEHLRAPPGERRLGAGGVWFHHPCRQGTEHGQVAEAGAWQDHERAGPEEARRLLYVGMTRGQTRAGGGGSNRRARDLAATAARSAGDRSGKRPRFRSLRCLEELTGSWDPRIRSRFRRPWRESPRAAHRRSLRDVRVGDSLKGRNSAHPLRAGCLSGGHAVARGNPQIPRLGRSGEFVPRVGVYGWRQEDVGAEWRSTYVADPLGVPLCEVVLRADKVPPAFQDCRK
jgi:hypothetical protein